VVRAQARTRRQITGNLDAVDVDRAVVATANAPQVRATHTITMRKMSMSRVTSTSQHASHKLAIHVRRHQQYPLRKLTRADRLVKAQRNVVVEVVVDVVGRDLAPQQSQSRQRSSNAVEVANEMVVRWVDISCVFRCVTASLRWRYWKAAASLSIT
jgi:hypothetical protein